MASGCGVDRGSLEPDPTPSSVIARQLGESVDALRRAARVFDLHAPGEESSRWKARAPPLSDQRGSPRLVVDVSSGAVMQRIDYDEFGAIVSDTNPGFQPFGFAGGLHDSDSGLVRLGERDYDPNLGRWTAKDEIAFRARSTNLYAYVDSDPINSIDDTGLGKIGTAIKIGKKAWNHITKRHVDRKKFPDKSKFKDPSKIKRDTNKTVRNPDRTTPQSDGRTVYEKDHGREIGTKGETKQRVVVDKDGNVVTTFPEKAWKVPGAAIGTDIFGDNPLGHAVDFFNPLSDAQDILDLGDDIFGEEEPEEGGVCE